MGQKPSTTAAFPHEQLNQIAPRDLQERLVALAAGLDGVRVGPSEISVPGARAFLMDEKRADLGPSEAFMVPGEFAHIHPPHDGSLHMVLPQTAFDQAILHGWGERHPAAGRFGTPKTIAMIYGPRDEAEFATVWSLLRISHTFASRRSHLELRHELVPARKGRREKTLGIAP